MSTMLYSELKSDADDVLVGAAVAPVDASVPTGLVELALADDEVLRRRMLARRLVLLAELDDRKVYRRAGHATMFGLLRARFGWSTAECQQHMRLARAGKRHPELLEVLAEGTLPIGHADQLARVLLRGRVTELPTFDSDLGYWLNEGGRSHDDFTLGVDQWDATATPYDPDADVAHARRSLRWRERDGMLHVSAQLDPLDGAEFVEIVARFCDAEFQHDWNARGDEGPLPRTDTQRAADALMAMARLAPTAPGAAVTAPTVNIVVDVQTFTDAVLYETLGIKAPDQIGDRLAATERLLPGQRACRTATGVAISPHLAAQAAIAGTIRWVIVDALGKPLHATSKQRFYRGAMREVITAMTPRCIHPGCAKRSGACDIDHHTEHQHGGQTSLVNASGNDCNSHNRFKSRTRIAPKRNWRGHWHLEDEHGNWVD